MREPVWISRAICDAIHADQIRQHGGLGGIRDEGALESALARPLNQFAYGTALDLPSLAAAYAHGLSRNHPYADGNKRVAFTVMYTFLAVNGKRFRAPEEEVVDWILKLASGSLNEAAFAKWVASRIR